MKEVMKYAMAMAVSAAAMFAYMYEAPTERAVQEVASNSPSTQATEMPVLSKEQRETNISKLFEVFNAMGGRQYATNSEVVDWETKRKQRDAAERAHYDRVNIEPWNILRGRCFSEEVSNDGTSRCEESWKYPRHHYYSAATQELLDLAYTDALAAKIASDRLVSQDAQLAFKLRMHATALSGKAGPLVDAAFSIQPQLNSDLEPAETDYAFFALMNVAAKLGYEHNNPTQTAENFSLDQEKLRELTDGLERQLSQLQSTVLGSTSLKELFDV
jgi:hypothetical protein